MLDVTRLRVLAAVARHGSVTAAARALNYAQPSVSHHLTRLESETGTRLIQRSGRGIQLTDAGRLLAGRAEEILGRLDAAEQELASHVGHREERIRVAGFPSALATLVPAAAARLRADHPRAELTLTEADPPNAARMVRGGRVDVAITFRYTQDGAVIGAGGGAGVTPVPGHDAGQAAGTPAGDDGARVTVLLDEPVHLVTQAGAPEPRAVARAGVSGSAATLGGYARHNWIAGCERCRTHLLWQCELAGFTPRIAFTTDHLLVIQALAAAGLGVALLPDLALRAARHPGVRATPLPGARREILALTYGEPPDPPAIAALLAALSTVAPAAPMP